MSDNLENVKRKIRGLLNMTEANGASEAEAMFAAQKVGELLKEYNLDMSMVEIKAIKCETRYVDHIGNNEKPADACIADIAKYVGCKSWLNTMKHNIRYVCFFGEPASLEMAEYLYRLIEVTIEFQSQNFKKTLDYQMAMKKKTAYVSFQKGMAHRIAMRLREMGVETYKDVSSSQNALVVAKNAIVEEQYSALQMELKNRVVVRSMHIDRNAYAAGTRVAEKVNLNRPLAGNSKTLKLGNG
jgi:hypothetical protein